MVDLPLDLTGSFTLLVVRDDVGVWNLTVKVIRLVVIVLLVEQGAYLLLR